MVNKRHKVNKHNILNDFVGTCRLCMSKSDALKSLFHTDCKIVQEIQYCTGILLTKDDNLPSSICLDCLTNLAVAHKFKTTCITSDETFRTIIEDVKVESICEDSKNEDDLVVKEEMDDLYTPDDDCDDVIVDLNDVNEFVKEKRPKKKKKTKVRHSRVGQGKFIKMYCTKCQVRFKDRKEAVEHRELLHKKDDYWICEICGKQLTHYASHYSHVRSHQPPQHACSHCDYKSSHKSDLTKHIRVHTGEKTFQCHFCTGTFRNSSNLHGHIQRNHVGQKDHVCSQCDKAFHSLQRLNRHLDSHNNIKRYQCEVCHSCFTRRCYWKTHLQKKHNIITPPLRPGRAKNYVAIEETPSIFNK